MSVVIGEVKRPHEMQVLYLKNGKSKKQHSLHEDCVAIDLSLFIDGVYQEDTEAYKPLGEYWESLDKDCVWGGRFGDNPATAKIEGWDGGHFQYGR